MKSIATPHELLAARAARARYRDGEGSPTTGVAPGFVQTNIIAVPSKYAYDMLLFAQRNPKPCPVLEVLDAGETAVSMAPGADIRTDLPKYRVWRDGELVAEPTEVTREWAEHDDLVTFLIGCSFTFEAGLLGADIPVRHIAAGRNVPMYRTNVQCLPAGALHGEMVVSMRSVPADRVADAVTITGRYPAVHGAPVHIGDPSGLGIADIMKPDFGDEPVVEPGDVPVFWACGVTPQSVVMASKIPFAITHAPGHMLVTDVPDAAYEQ